MTTRPPHQADHAPELQLSGSARRSPGLRLLEPLHDVPATTAGCPTERPCLHVRCKLHVQAIDTSDLAGRPRKVRPVRRMELPGVDPSEPSCTLDDERTRRGIEIPAREIAAREGVTERQVQRIVRRALAKLRRNPEARELLRVWLGGGE